MEPHLLFLLMCIPLTLATDAALQEFTSGNNLFTSSVYKEIVKTENGNFLLSPISAETILALTQSGAKDATAEELRTALHLPSQEKLETAVKRLKPVLRQNGLYSLQSANKIYIKEDFAIKDNFKKIATQTFGSELEKINFDQRDVAAKTMNKWVESRTENKIRNLIKRDDLNDRTRLILINALYFKGNWSNPFEKYQTYKQEFYKGSDVLKVDMMHDSATQKYFEDAKLNAKFLELSFEGGDVSFTIVLPNERDGLSKLETQLENVFENRKLKNEYVKVALPKFKIESTVDLKDVLQKLGVKKAFKDDEADLSGIAGEKGDLIIDKALQKSFVDVGEEGVEAAAATYVAVGVPLSGLFFPAPPKEFTVDHPFIFYIKYKDLILFAGRVVDPTQ